MNDFERAQEVRTKFAKWWTERRAQAFEYFSRNLAHSLGRRYFWDWPPADRKHFYALYPPVDVMGNAYDFTPEGGPNWSIIAQTRIGEYERYVDDYNKLLREEERKLAKAMVGE